MTKSEIGSREPEDEKIMGGEIDAKSDPYLLSKEQQETLRIDLETETSSKLGLGWSDKEKKGVEIKAETPHQVHNLENLRELISGMQNLVEDVAGYNRTIQEDYSFSIPMKMEHPGAGLQSSWILTEWLRVNYGGKNDPAVLRDEFIEAQKRSEKRAEQNKGFQKTLENIEK